MLLVVTLVCLFSANLDRFGKDFYFILVLFPDSNRTCPLFLISYFFIYISFFISKSILLHNSMLYVLIHVSNQNIGHV